MTTGSHVWRVCGGCGRTCWHLAHIADSLPYIHHERVVATHLRCTCCRHVAAIRGDG